MNDECFKMALTDAISVSCKALGVGADVYWNKDRTKYDDDDKKVVEVKAEVKVDTISTGQQKRLFAISQGNNDLVKEVLKMKNLTSTSQKLKNQIIQAFVNI